jgi:hypothetical protein
MFGNSKGGLVAATVTAGSFTAPKDNLTQTEAQPSADNSATTIHPPQPAEPNSNKETEEGIQTANKDPQKTNHTPDPSSFFKRPKPKDGW